MADPPETALGTEGSMLEGLFRALPPDPALVQALAGIGVEVTRLEPKYRSAQWRQTLELFRAHLYPELPVALGNQKIGFEFGRGFQDTLGGKLVLVALPLLTPLSLLMRWPRFVKLGRSDVTFVATRTGARAVTLRASDPARVPMGFSLGLFEFIFGSMKVEVAMRGEEHSPSDFTLYSQW